MATIIDMDQQRRVQLAQTVMGVLNGWDVPPDAQCALLGLPEGTKARKLNQFRSGTAFPEDHGMLLRAHYILSIQNAVASMYPHNTEVGNYWVTTPNPFFNERTPLQVMLESGVDGMETVVNHLNGTGDWY